MSTTALAPSSSTNTVAVTPVKSSSSLVQGQAGSSSSTTPQKFGAPGRWQHPRLDEVIRRRNATNFDSSNVRTITVNVLLIIASLFAPTLSRETLPSSILHSIHPYPTYAIYSLRLLSLLNITLSLLPIFRTPDRCEDVPLTPSQRRLLGLPPMSRPATPQEQEQYITPPRFSRSATPRSSSSSVFAEASQSPLSARGGSSSTPFDNSPSLWASASGSPLATVTARRRQSGAGGSQSPFGTPSALRGDGGAERRGWPSYHHADRSSPLSVSEFEAVGTVGTPTKGARASVGLNNKWLYEKGRGSPRASPGRGGLFA